MQTLHWGSIPQTELYTNQKNFIMERVKQILFCGAPNCAIARALNEEGFCFVTFGWDFVSPEGYMEYVDGDWALTDKEIGLASAGYALRDFEYFQPIEAKHVELLKNIYA